MITTIVLSIIYICIGIIIVNVLDLNFTFEQSLCISLWLPFLIIIIISLPFIGFDFLVKKIIKKLETKEVEE